MAAPGSKYSRKGQGHRGKAQRRRPADDTTTLPSALAEQLETTGKDRSADDNFDKRFAFRFNKNVLSRKAERKQKRTEKKQKISAHHGKKKGQVAQVIPVESTNAQKRKRNSADDTGSKKAKIEPSVKSFRNNKPSQKAIPNVAEQQTDQQRLQRLAKSNPKFYELLAEQNLVSGALVSTTAPSKKGATKDDKELARYEKLLKIKDKKKIPSAFSEDGLDFLFKGLMGEGEESDDGGDNEYLAAKRKAKAQIQDADEQSDEEEISASDEEDVDMMLNLEEGDEESDDLDQGSDVLYMTDSEDEDSDLLDEEVSDEEGQSLEGDEDDLEADSEDEQDNVSSAATVSGKAAASQPSNQAPVSAGKYIPPHLRKQPADKGEQYARLKRQIQGLLNRLSDANLESIFTAIEECYRSNSRHDVTEILTDSITSYIADHANLLDSFVMTYATLITCIFKVIGIEFGAHIIQTMVELYETSRATYLEAVQTNPDSVETTSKRCTNLVTLLAYLYNFEVVACILIYDIIRLTISGLSELDVEVLLRILRICGFQLRSDDPLALKDIVLSVQEEAAKRDSVSQSSRFKFMIETIMDLKNNKRKLQKRGNVPGGGDNTQQDRLKKLVANLAKKRYAYNNEPLRVGLTDIRSVKTKGKWWLVGAAWAGHDGAANASESDKPTAFIPETQQASSDLMKLARDQKMNTDVRRNIFVVLMSSEDCVDAYERLLKLNLKDKQEREIVRVLIHCCCQERVYNPYYALVGQKVCEQAHGFKITFQYALWDAFKAMAEGSDEEGIMDVRKVSNMAKLFAHLIGVNGLSLIILKALTFTSLVPLQTLFLKLLLHTLFVNYLQDGNKIRNVFNRVMGQENVKEGLVFFLKRWGKEGYDVGGKKVGEDVVRRVAGLAVQVLTGMGHA